MGGLDVVDGTVSRSFHRSVSMDIEKSPLSRQDMINRRKRINSTIDAGNVEKIIKILIYYYFISYNLFQYNSILILFLYILDNGLSLMCMPSAALQALVPCVDNAMIIDCPADSIVNNEISELNIFNRPSMEFIIDAHNLSDLKWSMKQAVRKSACRSYALQVRSVHNLIV